MSEYDGPRFLSGLLLERRRDLETDSAQPLRLAERFAEDRSLAVLWNGPFGDDDNREVPALTLSVEDLLGDALLFRQV